MNNGVQEFQNKISKSSDEEIQAMGSINISQYRHEFAELIRTEINKRNLSHEIQHVIFDFFVNGDGWAGRLILLEEQLLFLSIGQKAKNVSKSGGGVLGALAGSVGDADRAQQVIRSQSSDFSALENAGSWIYYLDEIVECEADSSWLAGMQLKMRFNADGEDASLKTVKFEELRKDDFRSLEVRIKQQKSLQG